MGNFEVEDLKVSAGHKQQLGSVILAAGVLKKGRLGDFSSS